MVHRLRPLPVGSRLINALYTHLRAASVGKCLRTRTALRIRALTDSMAFVEQLTLRISTSNVGCHRQGRKAALRGPVWMKKD